MSSPRTLLRSAVLATLGLLVGNAAVRADLQAVDDSATCPQTSPPTIYGGNSLDAGTPVKSGITFSNTNGPARLVLESATGLFKATGLGTSDQTVFAATADFNNDGWTDFVGTGETNGLFRVYLNNVASTPEPNWDDVNAVRMSNFTPSTQLMPSVALTRWRPTAAGDFNGDGWPDVIRAEAPQYGQPSNFQVWLNAKVNDAAGNPSFLAPYAGMAAPSTPASLQYQNWGGDNVVVTDINGDRKLDLIVGGASASSAGTASIRVFLNQCVLVNPLPAPLPATGPLPCATNPTFVQAAGTLGPANLGFPGTAGNLPVFAYDDVDGDGLKDLVVGGPACCALADRRLRLYKGLAGGNVDTVSPQTIAFPGGATAVFLADFSGDGKLDLIVGTDNFNYNPGFGAFTYYWINNGSSTPFSDAPQILTNQTDKALVNPATMTTTADFDVGFVFDYDHDPAHAPDLMIADGNHSASFFILANRAVAQYVPCGYVESSVLPLGALANSEMVVTGARMHPQAVTNGGTISYYMSNETPANWVPASDCGDNSGDVCATFPKPVGRDVRWKAELCANSARSKSPELRQLNVSFDYTEASDHFRSGVIVHDGVAYMGGFRQPGYRGHLFAVNAGLDTTYWDAATAIDAAADGTRHLYTADTAGTTRLDFTTANADSAALQATLGTADAADAAKVIDWVRSARFGVGNPGIAKSRLGAIETSTPAILTPPGLPLWWVYGSVIDKARHESFQTAQANRPNLVLVGAKDGMIHAIRTNPTSIKVAPSGTEAWGYIPSKIASGMLADYTRSLGGTTTVESYPDGSPTLADYRRADGTFGTIALVSSGNGGQSLVALDVTNTVDASSGNVLGPTPLWEAVPGGGDAGQGVAKPVLIRTRISGAERYVVVAATGLSPDNPAAPWTKGRIVVAYDAPTGAVLWKFQAACPVTSDLVAFETDDALEPGGPTFDGFMDRVVFADACGYLYKVDPAKSLGDNWNDNTGLGTIEVDQPDQSVHQYALFSTERTDGALGYQAPIAGTLGATSDDTGRMTLFFGTGGLESHPVATRNEFYAVHADDGSIRSKETGTCKNGRCEKFYGGVLVTADQVIFTRTVDPAVGTGTCDRGTSTVEAVDLAAATDGGFEEVFTQVVNSSVVGALYGDAGALYFANLAGESVRIGTPRAANAGDDSANPANVPLIAQAAGGKGTTAALNLMGWRQVF
ncbi:MAG TPA: FG-GAP-like repeat-containing protein [Kofleriaceae bacterium]|nr:FG-GAP-like repeat-containing protein [Kofleriaceae bacterium]